MEKKTNYESVFAGALLGVAGYLAYQYLMPCKGSKYTKMLDANSKDEIIGYFHGPKFANPDSYLINVESWKTYWLGARPEMTECINEWYGYAISMV